MSDINIQKCLKEGYVLDVVICRGMETICASQHHALETYIIKTIVLSFTLYV